MNAKIYHKSLTLVENLPENFDYLSCYLFSSKIIAIIPEKIQNLYCNKSNMIFGKKISRPRLRLQELPL